VKGTRREGSLAGDPERHVVGALETGISFHRGSTLGNLEEGLSTGVRCELKGALGTGRPSLWGLFLGNLEGGSFYGAP
jgi:hypothetical protein